MLSDLVDREGIGDPVDQQGWSDSAMATSGGSSTESPSAARMSPRRAQASSPFAVCSIASCSRIAPPPFEPLASASTVATSVVPSSGWPTAARRRGLSSDADEPPDGDILGIVWLCHLSRVDVPRGTSKLERFDQRTLERTHSTGEPKDCEVQPAARLARTPEHPPASWQLLPQLLRMFHVEHGTQDRSSWIERK